MIGVHGEQEGIKPEPLGLVGTLVASCGVLACPASLFSVVSWKKSQFSPRLLKRQLPLDWATYLFVTKELFALISFVCHHELYRNYP